MTRNLNDTMTVREHNPALDLDAAAPSQESNDEQGVVCDDAGITLARSASAAATTSCG